MNTPIRKIICLVIISGFVLSSTVNPVWGRDTNGFQSVPIKKETEPDSREYLSSEKKSAGSIYRKIGIPISIAVGYLAGYMVTHLDEEESEGVAMIAFAAGFGCSMLVFLLIADKKDREESNKFKWSSLDIAIRTSKPPVLSRTYFINYNYHF